MENLIASVFGLDSIIGIILLVFMVTTWYLRREASRREHDARQVAAQLKHERDMFRDTQFFGMHSEMLSLLRDCQKSVSLHLDGDGKTEVEEKE